MPKPYPQEFRDEVVSVARNREPGQTMKQITADFGIAESCLRNWMRQAGDVDQHSAHSQEPGNHLWSRIGPSHW